ncbi:far upstream element-binding protein 3 [Sitophilus oryzae]|uniref:Far upstream element-binding protein 3 n=1 Tax=Sitophilus oryzae TaxID=7048 RepID=A0A6J2YCN4_SITOR|nr:far upstream element-binding protein 3 [Sitophilus oryzae]
MLNRKVIGKIAAKINPGGTPVSESRGKRPLEDSPEPDAKKGPGLGPPQMGRPPQVALPMGGPIGNGPPGTEDMKAPGPAPGDKMGMGMRNPLGMGGPPGGQGGRNSLEIMIPGPKVGLIIGKGGETIKQLQEKSGAKMVVIQDGPAQELEKPLVISGDPQKIEYAKQLVYDLIAEKEMKSFNNRGGGGGGRGRNDNRAGGDGYSDYGGGGGGDFEVLVPKAAVGVVIGKGGDMIKKIQAETGCRVQFQQARDEGPGDRRCSLNGNPKQVDHARQRIEELIDSVMQRDGGHDGPMGGGHAGGRGGRGGGRGGRGGGRGGGHFGGDRNGGGGDYGGAGGWNDRGGPGPQQEVSFTVPANKCGVIIGRGGETIKQINQQSGAFCELDRRSSANQNEKTFTIKGDPDCIEAAKRIISDKIQMPIHFLNMGGAPAPMANNIPTAYPGMAPQGYNPQGWGGMPNYPQQQWGQQGQGDVSGQSNTGPAQGPPQGGAGGGAGVQVNPSTGQPDYSLQWAEYYRSLGMHREAEVIEHQAKARTGPTPEANGAAPPVLPQAGTQPGGGAQAPASAGGSGQPDYSAQWAEYYRSIGKMKEAEAIEAQMKNKTGGAAAPAAPVSQGAAQVAPGGYQQPYGGYQQPGGYYAGQPQAPVPGGVGQQNYGFPQYGYGGQPTSAPPNPPDN